MRKAQAIAAATSQPTGLRRARLAATQRRVLTQHTTSWPQRLPLPLDLDLPLPLPLPLVVALALAMNLAETWRRRLHRLAAT